MALNFVRDKGKPRYKLSYKLLQEKDGYVTLIKKCPFQTLIQLNQFLDGIQHYVTVVGKWVFDSNVVFEITLTSEYL